MHRILVISRFLAPSSAVGGKRFSYFTREFAKRGFDVHAVTAALSADDPPDMSLKAGGTVVRTPAHARLSIQGNGLAARAINRVAKAVLAPLDTDPLWIGPAVRIGRHLASQVQDGVVIGTMPPLSAGTVAACIAKSSAWPLILDYRDPWSAYPWPHKLRGIYSRGVATRLEQRYVAASAARVFNTPEMRDWFQQYFPRAPKEWNFVIPNGLDVSAADVADTGEEEQEIVHAGAIYGDRSLLPVVRALARTAALHPELPRIRLAVYGEVPENDMAAIRREKHDHFIEVRPRISRTDLESVLCRARALLVVSGGQMGYSIPYKIYDYLAARRPVLALAPAGTAVQRFMNEFAVGEHADPADEQAVQRALEGVLRKGATVDPRALEVHRWSSLADTYVEVIDKVMRVRPARKGRAA